MSRALVTAVLLLVLALRGSAALARERSTLIDLSVAADGSCQVRIGDRTIPATQQSLEAKLPSLLPNKKAPLHFSPSYEKVPDRCFGPVLASLQRLHYDSISFDTEPPPLGAEYTSPDRTGQ